MNVLVQFGSSAMTVKSSNAKFGMERERLMSVGEFKKSKKVKGNEATRQYNRYLIDNGKVGNGDLSKAMAEGKLLTTSQTYYSKAGTWLVRFKEVAKLRNPVDRTVPAKPVEIGEVYAGLTDADKAAFIAQFIGKAA